MCTGTLPSLSSNDQLFILLSRPTQQLARLKQAKAERGADDSRKAALADWKKEEKAKVAAGKKPFFLKKRAQRELEMDRRFQDLAKGRGGKKKVERLIEKRRKKNAYKDRRSLPGARIDHRDDGDAAGGGGGGGGGGGAPFAKKRRAY